MSVIRKTLLGLSTNAWVRDRATRYGFVKRSVRRFMPGETVEEAIAAARELQPQGITTILTKLGENLTAVEEAEDVTRHYLDVLDMVAASGLDAQVSIKPTQLGLDFDRGLCERNLDRLIARAEARDNIIWIDMESSPYVDRTLDLFRRTRARTLARWPGPAGVPLSHRRRSRLASPARLRHPHRQRGVSRAAQRRLSQQSGRG